MWRCSAADVFDVQMFEDFSYDPRLGNESHDAQRSSAGTQERVELEDSSNQIRPSPPQCLLGSGAGGGPVFLGLAFGDIPRLGGPRSLASSSNDVCVVSVIEQQMSPGLWDLGDDARQELERVDCFEPREELARLVVRGFGRVEDVRRTRAPLHSG